MTWEQLSKAKLFHGFKPDELGQLAAVAIERRLSSKWVILRAGEHNSSVFVICAGSVDVIQGASASQVHIARLGPGQCFGEMSLMGTERASATLIVHEDCVLAEITSSALEGMLNQKATLWGKLWRNIALELRQRLVSANARIADLESSRPTAAPQARVPPAAAKPGVLGQRPGR